MKGSLPETCTSISISKKDQLEETIIALTRSMISYQWSLFLFVFKFSERLHIPSTSKYPLRLGVSRYVLRFQITSLKVWWMSSPWIGPASVK